MKKIYKHRGLGHYLGSCIIVRADNLDDAKKMVKHELVLHGLSNEELNVFEVIDDVIHVDDGDY